MCREPKNVVLLLAGVGTAMMAPVVQSLTPAMVQRPWLRQAIALNSMGTNVSRDIGPVLGGLAVASDFARAF